jgi:hypothetical protein
MMRLVALAVICLLCTAAGALIALRVRGEPREVPTPAVVQRVREAARLETLDVQLYRKIDFSPDPQPTDGAWSALASWARHTLRTPRGRAIIFAEAQLSLDLRKLDEQRLRAVGHKVFVVLPRPEVRVALKPGETEVIGSNLDTDETAQLYEQARQGFMRAVEADAGLQEKARESARRALATLFAPLGFTEVELVKELPRASLN